jgi:hypothetical protein
MLCSGVFGETAVPVPQANDDEDSDEAEDIWPNALLVVPTLLNGMFILS